ncbi:MAG: c-type cytochrome [Gemmatimonadota bacterium]|nr:c-type cytochrome [Gemmatimonadota bacterium]
MNSRDERTRSSIVAALLILAMTACGRPDAVVATPPDHSATVAPVPATSLVDSIVIPDGPAGVQANRGFAILAATRDSMPEYVGAGLRCFSCHLENGTRPNAIPLVGAYVRYPNYASRDDRVISIQDRVNNCFQRSLAGRRVPVDDPRMTAIVMYLAVMSRGVRVGSHVAGEGMPMLAMRSGDTARGSAIFTARCARCHGMDGQGIPPATALWGPRSYAIGASLARLERAATFIRHNMPFDSAGVLDDQQAFDVASYVLTHARPDSPDKQSDWSRGGAPADVPYATQGHVAFNPPRLLPAPMK